MEKKDGKGMSRREFIKTAGITAAGVIASSLVPSRLLGAPASGRVLGANDRINIAFIGLGIMGNDHITSIKSEANNLNANLVAVCDLWDKRRLKAQSKIGCPDSMAFTDYRKLLENKDIDAVVIASPPHWHSAMAIDAMEAGKHVYIQKPLSRTLEEAFEIHAATKRTGRVVQVGSQGCSDAKWHTAAKAIQDGKIGTVICGQGSYCRNNPGCEWNIGIDPDLNEKTCDWNMWLGKSPKRPFNPERFFRWRKYWDYSSGIISDLWPHRLHPLMIAMANTEFPSRVTCIGSNVCNTDMDPKTGKLLAEKSEVPELTMMTVEFPSGSMIYLLGTTLNERGMEDIIRGQHATLYFGGGRVMVKPERAFSEDAEEEVIPVVGPGESFAAHEKNWIDCIRENKAPNCNIDLALKVQTMLSLAEKSYREHKMVSFDPVSKKIIG